MMSTETRRALHVQAPEGTWLGDWMHDFRTHLAAAGVAPVHMTRAKYAEVYGTDALAALDAFHTRTAEKVAAVDRYTQCSEEALARLRAGDYGALSDCREAEAALDAEQYMPTPARRENSADVSGVFQTHRGIEIDTPGDVYETARGVYLVTPFGDWLLSDRLTGDVQRRLKFALRRRLAG